MEYNPKEIESKWQQQWADSQIYKVENHSEKPKYYVLDMFPYPSGAGLHVGHPLGYIATDIVARYKRLKGFHVLHPMGFDSFGLPAEQYAISTGQHPAKTTEENIITFKSQFAKIGFSYDWSREVQTSSPDFYRWTQWIFGLLFNSWYNKKADKAEKIDSLIALFQAEGNANVQAFCDSHTPIFSAQEWTNFDFAKQQELLAHYRLTYLSEAMVNWCPAMGTVLANDEVKDGFSERGGFPVERKKMKQWMMRITAYADRLLKGLDTLDWSDSIKEIQRNWIGKSMGAELDFKVDGKDITLTVFTTRIDTIFGVTYVSIAPESDLIAELTTSEQKDAVDHYVHTAINRSERERMADVKTVSGVFTGSYVINPFNNEKIPIWIADYVLAGYGTGVVMAVPSSDERDFKFAKHFDLPIIYVIEGTENLENPCDKKHGKLINSGFLNGMETKDAILKAIEKCEELGVGTAKINYKMHNAVFGRQRYWGEPIPVYYENGIPKLIDSSELPLVLPEIDQYKPTETGEPPLARAKNWKYKGTFEYEHTTMPGWAGSSWYFARYKDAQNDKEFCDQTAEKYWGQVDLYLGGAEHGTGHLLYSRFWNKFLKDLGYISHEEPFKKLINQGMIQGVSSFVYKLKDQNTFVSKNLRKDHDSFEIHVDISLVKDHVLDVEGFKKWRSEYANSEFILENGKYICGDMVEKMSKSKHNTVNPDDIIARYGADTLRLYEMFLGPLTQFKPWDTHGIDGVLKFLKKLWRLFYDAQGNFVVSNEAATPAELKILHKTIKRIAEEIERDSFNTPVSMFMICVNEFTALKCHKASILSDFLVILSPYAPHISEELWHLLGKNSSIIQAEYPIWKQEYVQESSFEYPIMINGKMRAKMNFSLDMPQAEMEREVLASEHIQKWLEGKAPKKMVIVPNKIVNLVV
ncbi:MAG: leucine--tRNA ligase [Bacteroidetes bacterium]|nr:MAG: leucine--tRNA ligase [Bacteroidota bacterium]